MNREDRRTIEIEKGKEKGRSIFQNVSRTLEESKKMKVN
jgi:hypothetical protein